MSTDRATRADRPLALASAALLLALVACGALYSALGIDPLGSGWKGVPCPFHALTGIVCPGCGMTRALLLASQLQWLAALRMNPLVALVLLYALGFAASGLAGRSGTPGRSAVVPAGVPGPRLRERLALPALALVALHWLHALAS